MLPTLPGWLSDTSLWFTNVTGFGPANPLLIAVAALLLAAVCGLFALADREPPVTRPHRRRRPLRARTAPPSVRLAAGVGPRRVLTADRRG